MRNRAGAMLFIAVRFLIFLCLWVWFAVVYGLCGSCRSAVFTLMHALTSEAVT